MRQYSRQASKIKTKSFEMFLNEVTSFITDQSFVTQSTSLGVAKAGNLKLDFMAKKASEFIIFSLHTFLDVIDIPKPQNPVVCMDSL